ncbi:hypothetical protein LCGC14_0373240 [marine sediment metagenome]|uniref:Uncharacterized protein n=1 Tax=marine sediment metagenome TaxID=412755 RepID=A0A0F9TAA0_9ZZZZ
MPKYNHAIDFAAEVVTDNEYEVSATEARTALLERLNRLTDHELLEAIGIFDTHEEGE